MQKSEFLSHLAALPANQPVNPSPVPYKHEGSTYSEDGIRITGSRAFIDSVLSRVKDLLAFENGETRLQVSYQESTDRKTRARIDSFNCYIQVHKRGGQAVTANAFISAMRGKETIVSKGY